MKEGSTRSTLTSASTLTLGGWPGRNWAGGQISGYIDREAGLTHLMLEQGLETHVWPVASPLANTRLR